MFDIVVHGATGFVGRLVLEHLAAHAPEGVSLALSGRSRERLEAVSAGRWPVLVTDAHDTDAVQRLARSTRVVLTTVGPYARHGMPLLAACARTGTDYVDLTGEVLFVREAIDRAHQVARRSGARIVPSCGFDSVPSDLSVHLLAGAAGTLGDTTLLVTRMRGGISGGTLDSLRVQLQTMRTDPAAARLAGDPYGLSPDLQTEPRVPGQRESAAVFVEPLTGAWTAPFVMSSYNTRVVRRSHALVRERDGDAGYGPAFRYRERVATGQGAGGWLKAQGVRAGIGALMVGMGTPGLSTLVDRALPAPGEGPTAQARREGLFETRTHVVVPDGRPLVATVAAQGDPGYAATAVMVAQAALGLATESEGCHPGGGVLTPAVALGDVLIDRLRAQGFTLSVTAG